MTSAEQNLKIVTDHVARLSDNQRHASDLFIGANRSTGNVAETVSRTHGLVCQVTNIALSAAEAARKSAGQSLHEVGPDG